MEFKLSIDYTQNAYGFGQDWTLVISKGVQERRFWLGQDAKVCTRILGSTSAEVALYCENETGSRDVRKPEVQDWIARHILAAISGGKYDAESLEEKSIRNSYVGAIFANAEDWALAVQ